MRFSKASFFEWSDTKKYSTYHFRGSSFSVHLYVNRDQNYFKWHSSLNPSLPITLNYSLLPTSVLLSRPLKLAALMFFFFFILKFKDSSTLQNQMPFYQAEVSYVLINNKVMRIPNKLEGRCSACKCSLIK